MENGQILIEAGRSLTGINWGGPALPSTNYELALQAMRVDGNDFFAGVTFPVGDSFCSLILGGWGGSVVGLSSINDVDASENETSQAVTFDQKRWYNIRIRVTPAKIEAWLDDRELVNVDSRTNESTSGLRWMPPNRSASRHGGRRLPCGISGSDVSDSVNSQLPTPNFQRKVGRTAWVKARQPVVATTFTRIVRAILPWKLEVGS